MGTRHDGLDLSRAATFVAERGQVGAMEIATCGWPRPVDPQPGLRPTVKKSICMCM
jgi:hypothetical protein